MKLSNNRYEEIKTTAVNLCIKYNISCVPVSSFEIAQKMNIKICPYPNKNKNIFLKMSGDGFNVNIEKMPSSRYIIYYNPDKMYQRTNNTIMHEIGHIVLGHTEASELAEAEANFFAKYLLAPPVLIHKLNLKSPKEIAKIFEISHQASEIAWTYYKHWLENSGGFYKPYEIKMLNQFIGGYYINSNNFIEKTAL